MRVIIAGGRDYRFSDHDHISLDGLVAKIPITEVVSGHQRGADQEGERWARSRGICVKEFPADWDKHGRAAGPIRDRKMAVYARALIAFPGGRGTADMVEQAEVFGLKVFDWRKGT